MNHNKKHIKIAGIVMVTLSVPMFIAAIYFYVSTNNFIENSTQGQGIIVELIEEPGSEGGVTYTPVYEFKDSNNKTVRVRSSMSSYPAAYELDEEIDIYYNPEDSQDSKIDGIMDLWGFSIFFGIGAVLDLIMGASFIFIPKLISKS